MNEGSRAERRLAFRRAFPLYGDILNDMAAKTEVHGIERHALTDAALNPKLVKVYAAQFALRMLRTRERYEIETNADVIPAALPAFVQGRIVAYQAFSREAFEGRELRASDARLRALGEIEAAMSSTAFEALAVDCQTEDFDEGQFWRDFFRGIADNSRTPYMTAGFELGWLGYMLQFTEAMKTDAASHVTV